MKYLTTLFLCLASVFHMHAQSLSLFDVDASGFPAMKAKFRAYDAAGNQVRPSAGELSLTESGQPRTITSVTCPPPKPPVAISSVLTVDVSGSMSGVNIGLAKAAAQAWIQGLPMGISECALTSFDNSNYLAQDFTTDRARLLNALATLSPNGGTDYDMGLLTPLAGSLQVSQRGHFKHVVVFLSDGMPNSEPNTAAIIAEATRQNCLIFAVTLGMPCPQSLKDIALQTGGLWYENVTTTPEAVEVYRKIMQTAMGNDPCEISWKSDLSCEIGNSNVSLQWQTQTARSTYIKPPSAIASLEVSPSFVAFGKQLPLTQYDTTITLTAQNADFSVTGINRTFGSADFIVVNTTFPLFIPTNTPKTIALRFAPKDSNRVYASFDIITDKCTGYCSASGGFPGKKMTTSTLKLTHPNGGEAFVVGSDTTISWNGIAPSDLVRLEYTIDNGTTWKPITTNASNLQYIWKNIPKPTSNNCKVRVKQVGGASTPGTEQFNLSGHTEYVTAVQWSPDGSKVATASWDNTAIIWSATNGTKLFTLNEHNNSVTAVHWSPDGTKVATSSRDHTAIIWSSTTGTKLFTLIGHTDEVIDIQWSPDGTKVATASYDATAIIWSATSGSKLFTFSGHSRNLNAIQWCPDGLKLVTSSWDGSAIIWSAASGTKLFTLKGSFGYENTVQWSPDGSKVVITSLDKSAIIWSATSGIVLFTLNGHTNDVIAGEWSPDGAMVATASALNAKIWSATSGIELFTLKGHTGYINAVQWSPDGAKVATASSDGSARIWYVENNFLQEDSSDAVFSIVAPMSASQNVDMLQCLVGSGRDSVVATFVQNTGVYPFRVDSILIVGADASQFSLVSGIPPFTVPAGRARSVEFHFAPTSLGVKTAQIVIYTQADTLRQAIQGKGTVPSLSVLGDIIDFGRVEVGKLKDTMRVVTIKNTGTVPLNITSTHHAGPNDIDFTTVAGGGNFTVAQGDTAKLDLRFSPKSIGRTSGRLLFEYNGFGSPASVQLYGEGSFNTDDTARTTIIAQDITAQAGEKVNLTLKLQKSTGMQITGAPTEWYARIHYNKSILYNLQTDNQCLGTTDSCMLELSGVYDPKSDELIAIPCITTLGNTDHSMIVIDTFLWMNSTILTEVATQNGTITLNGVCDDGGVRLFIPATTSTSLSTRPNPAQDKLEIHYGLREPLTVTLEFLTMTGQVAQTILTNQAQAAGQYTLTSDLSLLGNGVYLLRMRTNKEMLTTRVDVVK